jgi:HAD superfamily hydrolase (TIGR01509 family)
VITTVAFDADDTLVDTRAAVRLAIEAVVAWAREPSLTHDVFQADAAHYWSIWPERPAREIRGAALRHSLTRAGREADLDAAIELFFDVRFANSRPFPGTVDVLTTLKADYRLGYGTNANSEATRCGLGGLFAFEIYALTNGVPKKPDPLFYAAMLEAAGASAAEFVYVGDNYEFDVVAPKLAGMRGVWLNPHGKPVPGDTEPDAVIENLVELPRILAGWR